MEQFLPNIAHHLLFTLTKLRVYSNCQGILGRSEIMKEDVILHKLFVGWIPCKSLIVLTADLQEHPHKSKFVVAMNFGRIGPIFTAVTIC